MKRFFYFILLSLFSVQCTLSFAAAPSNAVQSENNGNNKTLIVDTVTVIPANETVVIPNDDELSSAILRGKSLSGYCIGKYEVTCKQWAKVVNWGKKNGYTLADDKQSSQYPVSGVKFIDAIIWCNALSEMAGLTPVYYADAAYKNILKNRNQIKILSEFDKLDEEKQKEVLKKAIKDFFTYYNNMSYTGNKLANEISMSVMLSIVPNSFYIKSVRCGNTILSGCSANGYRLPTDEEWEYAAHGGGDSDIPAWSFKYSGSNTLSNVGWYANNSGLMVHKVGELRPNSLGIYDMSGNVWEWTSLSVPFYSILFGDFININLNDFLETYNDSEIAARMFNSRLIASFIHGGGYSDEAGECAVLFKNWAIEKEPQRNRYSYNDDTSKNYELAVGFRVARSLF